MTDTGFRNLRRRPFTQVDNAVLTNPALSLEAKGLLTLMLSRPDDWVYRMSWLERQSRNGRHVLRRCVKELEEAGYLRRTPLRGEDGRMRGWVYEVSDTPLTIPAPICSSTDIRQTRRAEEPSFGGSPPTKKEVYQEGEKKKKHTSPDGEEREIAQLISIWNEHRGPLPAARLTARRKDAMKEMMEVLGGDCLSDFMAAVQEVAQDLYWEEHRFGLDNLLADQKYVSKAEAFHSRTPARSTLE